MDTDKTEFLSKEDVILFVQSDAAEKKRPFRFTRRDGRRVWVACTDEACPFELRFWRRADGLFYLVKRVDHDCLRFEATVTPRWIQDVVHASLANNAALTTTELRDIVSGMTQADVSWKKVHYAKTRVVAEMDVGDSSYRKLVDMVQRVMAANPGSVSDVLVDDKTYRSLFCPGACVRAFAHCHPIAFVDGCHMKAACGGVLLFASTID